MEQAESHQFEGAPYFLLGMQKPSVSVTTRLVRVGMRTANLIALYLLTFRKVHNDKPYQHSERRTLSLGSAL